MSKLARKDLWSLEEYSERRKDFRTQVIGHKKNRQLNITEYARLYFEDELTIRYQIQEMLRIEKIFEAAGIQEELDAYNPLIPDGNNLKATFMLEYDDETVRRQQLQKLIGVEDRVWLQVSDCEKVFAIADEDMERENDDKTSSVHFLRFEFTVEMILALKSGAGLRAGINHRETQTEIVVPELIRASLVNDLKG